MLFIIPARISLNKAIARQLLRHFPLHFMNIEQVQRVGLKFESIYSWNHIIIFINSTKAESIVGLIDIRGQGFLAVTLYFFRTLMALAERLDAISQGSKMSQWICTRVRPHFRFGSEI